MLLPSASVPAAVEVRVERTPLRIVVRDLAGNVISSDAVGRPTKFQLGGFSVHKTMPGDEHYFGLGDKAGTFDRRNQAYTLWNTDIGTQEAIDPIYKSIPFFLGIGGGRSYGLFLDNTWRTWFDFGKQVRDAYSFGAEGGPLDYYVIYGPTPKQVVEGYTYLTGTHPLPPLVGPWISAVSLQLHAGVTISGNRRTPARRTRSRPTCSISTSTTRTGIGRSRLIRKLFRTSPAWCRICASNTFTL